MHREGAGGRLAIDDDFAAIIVDQIPRDLGRDVRTALGISVDQFDGPAIDAACIIKRLDGNLRRARLELPSMATRPDRIVGMPTRITPASALAICGNPVIAAAAPAAPAPMNVRGQAASVSRSCYPPSRNPFLGGASYVEAVLPSIGSDTPSLPKRGRGKIEHAANRANRLAHIENAVRLVTEVQGRHRNALALQPRGVELPLPCRADHGRRSAPRPAGVPSRLAARNGEARQSLRSACNGT